MTPRFLFWTTAKLYNAYCIVMSVLSADSSSLTLQRGSKEEYIYNFFPENVFLLEFYGILISDGFFVKKR